MNAAGLRPAPSISVCKRRRPDVAGRSALAKIAPSSASASPSRSRAVRPAAPFETREPAVEAAFAQFARDILEHDLRAVEPRHAGQTLRHQPRREHRALRLEGDTAVQTGRAPGDRFGRPAGPARAGSRGMPIAAAITAGASSDSASIDPSIRGTSSKRSAPRPCTLLPPIMPAN